ncbi:MAG TPA: epoxyqueuosine reductase QueH [Candidatus Omnitrophica bacterium]|nr:epoxyqueuosine reductase QueH [Candidatus Omnitrophota bacterium]
MKKILLHICCGVCTLYPIEKLRGLGFYVEGFFFNPNIYPYKEYLKRKKVIEKVKDLIKIKIIEGEYNPFLWLDVCKDYKEEKEGGKRCFLCYELRLKRTFKVLKEKKFDYFTTTLTVSPYKKSKAIISLGREMTSSHFFPIDFKKEDGFKKTIQLAKEFGLYRQNYCGCIYSYYYSSSLKK